MSWFDKIKKTVVDEYLPDDDDLPEIVLNAKNGDYGKVWNTIKAEAKDCYEESFVADAVGICREYVIPFLLDFGSIKNKILEFAIPNAFKFKIQAAKKNAVNVGLFDKESVTLASVNLSSPLGISDSLKTDTWYYL